MDNVKQTNKVTLLHKGFGPTLFHYQAKPYPITDLNPRNSPRCSSRGCEKPAKRVIVKCIDRQDANSMFSKRLRARDRSALRPSTTTKLPRVEKLRIVPKQPIALKHKALRFPPPSFLPRWNPRHKDRTYLEKMVLEDPWSLPKEKRMELQRKTGLRLKSLSRHYQFKVGANLPYGKDALDAKCQCYVEFCDHCTAKYETSRCPLHMQLLEGATADCKTELTEFCPFSKNPEDLPLSKIKDAGVYVSEVVRRLRAGEISEAPKFPQRLLLDPKANLYYGHKKVTVETSSQLDLTKKTPTEDSYAQTEPFQVDMDMSNADGRKDNLSQTMKPPLDEPLLVTKLKPIKTALPYIAYGSGEEKDTQVTPFMIIDFDKIAGDFSKKLTSKIVFQSIKEVRDEAVIYDIQREAAGYVQQLCDIQRTQHFRHMQEQFRNEAYAQEEYTIVQEVMTETSAEINMGAALFASVFMKDFAAKAMDSLRKQGLIVNQDLRAIQDVLREEQNEGMLEKFNYKEYSTRLLDEIVCHALNDLEIDHFLNNMVDDRYLHPMNYTYKMLLDIVKLKDENMKTMETVRNILLSKGWKLDGFGKLYNDNEMEGDIPESTSEENLEAFLEKIRVSVDSEGNPKYLMDVKGRALPINVVWLPSITNNMKTNEQKGKGVWDPNMTFDITLSKTSLLSTAEELGENTSTSEPGRKTLQVQKDGEIDVSFDDDNVVEEEEGEGRDDGEVLYKFQSERFLDDDVY